MERYELATATRGRDGYFISRLFLRGVFFCVSVGMRARIFARDVVTFHLKGGEIREIYFNRDRLASLARGQSRFRAFCRGAFAADSRSIASMLTSLSLSSFSLKQLMGLLKPTDKNWQPQDFLPDPESEEFLDNIKEIQKRAEGVSDDLMVVLVGDMITEEALPTYMNMLNTLDETKDITGADGTPWAQWTKVDGRKQTW